MRRVGAAWAGETLKRKSVARQWRWSPTLGVHARAQVRRPRTRRAVAVDAAVAVAVAVAGRRTRGRARLDGGTWS